MKIKSFTEERMHICHKGGSQRPFWSWLVGVKPIFLLSETFEVSRRAPAPVGHGAAAVTGAGLQGLATLETG